MNNRAVTLSLVMALIAVFFVYSYVSSLEDEQKKKFGTEVYVLVSAKDINEMETIHDTSFSGRLVPRQYVEPGAFAFKTEGDEAKEQIKRLTGAVALVPIRKDEQFTYSKITDPSIRTGLSPQIAPGRRAVSIEVTDRTSVGKLLKPGDRVDVIVIIDISADPVYGKLVKTLFQDIPILATGKNVSNNPSRVIETDPSGASRVKSLTRDDGFNTVTVELDPAQAQQMIWMQFSTKATIILSLRNNEDSSRGEMSAIDLKSILQYDPREVPDRRAPASQPNGGLRK